MIPQIGKRKIGNITILDIKGSLTGVWALRRKQDLAHQLANEDIQNTILNLRTITDLDTVGAKAILESVPQDKDVALLAGNQGVMDLMSRFSTQKRLRFLWNEKEIVSTFGKDLVSLPTGDEEKRQHTRLPTALPIEFYYCAEDEEPVRFRAVITNLSEGGLFAEYIDLKVAEQSLERLNPYDLNLLHLVISLPKGKLVEAEGKVVHRKLDGEQLGVGVEFFKIGLQEQKEISNFLKNYRASYEY